MFTEHQKTVIRLAISCLPKTVLEELVSEIYFEELSTKTLDYMSTYLPKLQIKIGKIIKKHLSEE